MSWHCPGPPANTLTPALHVRSLVPENADIKEESRKDSSSQYAGNTLRVATRSCTSWFHEMGIFHEGKFKLIAAKGATQLND